MFEGRQAKWMGRRSVREVEGKTAKVGGGPKGTRKAGGEAGRWREVEDKEIKVGGVAGGEGKEMVGK